MGGQAAQLGEQLTEFVDYLNGRYAWGTEHTIPPCWAAHGALVEELTTLMWARWSAFEGPGATPEAAQTWHTFFFPGFMARMITWVGRQALGECRAGNHEPSRLMPASQAKFSYPSAPDRLPPSQLFVGAVRRLPLTAGDM